MKIHNAKINSLQIFTNIIDFPSIHSLRIIQSNNLFPTNNSKLPTLAYIYLDQCLYPIA